MNARRLLLCCTVVGLLMGGSGCEGPTRPYTATALLEVQPYNYTPLRVQQPPVDKHLQESYCRSVAAHVGTHAIQRILLEDGRIQQTKWYIELGSDVSAAIVNLRRNLSAKADPAANVVTISMTCHNPDDAALIANVLLESIIRSRVQSHSVSVSERLKSLQKQEEKLVKKLDDADTALDGIRVKYKVTSLDEHTCHDPTVARVMELQSILDMTLIETAAARARFVPKKLTGSESCLLKRSLAVLVAKQTEIRRLLKEAETARQNYDRARIEYAPVLAGRNDLRVRLSKVHDLIGELNFLAEYPQFSGLRILSLARVKP